MIPTSQILSNMNSASRVPTLANAKEALAVLTSRTQEKSKERYEEIIHFFSQYLAFYPELTRAEKRRAKDYLQQASDLAISFGQSSPESLPVLVKALNEIARSLIGKGSVKEQQMLLNKALRICAQDYMKSQPDTNIEIIKSNILLARSFTNERSQQRFEKMTDVLKLLEENLKAKRVARRDVIPLLAEIQCLLDNALSPLEPFPANTPASLHAHMRLLTEVDTLENMKKLFCKILENLLKLAKEESGNNKVDQALILHFLLNNVNDEHPRKIELIGEVGAAIEVGEADALVKEIAMATTAFYLYKYFDDSDEGGICRTVVDHQIGQVILKEDKHHIYYMLMLFVMEEVTKQLLKGREVSLDDLDRCLVIASKLPDQTLTIYIRVALVALCAEKSPKALVKVCNLLVKSYQNYFGVDNEIEEAGDKLLIQAGKFKQSGEIEQAIEYTKAAIEIFKCMEVVSSKKVAAVEKQLANYHVKQGVKIFNAAKDAKNPKGFERAGSVFTQAMEIYQKSESNLNFSEKEDYGFCLYNMGSVFHRLGNVEAAIELTALSCDVRIGLLHDCCSDPAHQAKKELITKQVINTEEKLRGLKANMAELSMPSKLTM